MSQTKAQLINGKSATVEFTAGSPSTPAVTFTGDTNTGIYSPGADQLAISTGGTGRLFVDASGRVGVGTNTPGSLLTLKQSIVASSDTAPTLIKLENGSDGGSAIEFSNNVAGKAKIALGVEGTGVATDDTFIGFSTSLNTTLSEKVRITSAGLVGVGTSSPVAKFQINVQDGFRFDVGANAYSYMQFGSAGAGEGTAEIGFERSSGKIFLKNTISGSLTTFLTGDGAGRVGIGTTSPSSLLHTQSSGQNATSFVSTASSTVLNLQCADTGSITINAGGSTNPDKGRLFYSDNSVFWGIYTNDLERARIDSSGRLLVGTSTARLLFTDYTPSIQLEGTTNSTSSASLVNNSNGAAGPTLFFAKSRATSNGGVTVVSADDELGVIAFSGADGTDLTNIGATIKANVDGTPGSNDLPTRLVFSTTADGANSPTERMRIRSNGTINFSNVATYADNAAATTGGLAVGDVYRTSTGQLMIRY